MDFVAIDIFFFDMVPTLTSFWIIKISFEYTPILRDGMKVYETFIQELLDNYLEKIFEGFNTYTF